MMHLVANRFSSTACARCGQLLFHNQPDSECKTCISRDEDEEYADEFGGDCEFEGELVGESFGASAECIIQIHKRNKSGQQGGRKRAFRKGQSVNLVRSVILDANGKPQFHANGIAKVKVRIDGQHNVHTKVKVDDAAIGVSDSNQCAAVVNEFKKRMDAAGGYSRGKSFDGSYYKYSSYMKKLFEHGPVVPGGLCFQTRSDFFKEGAPELADSIFHAIALQKLKDPTDIKKLRHEVRCLRHGFDTFVKLVNDQK